MPFKTQVDYKVYPLPKEVISCYKYKDFHKLDLWRRQTGTLFDSPSKYYKELKKLARRGFMDGHRGWAWSRILKLEEISAEDRDYSSALHQIFGSSIPVHTQAPFFGGQVYFERLALSENGMQTVRNILCIVAHNYPNLNYSPIIPSITAIICHHMSSYDALGCIVAMIKSERKEDWSFFPLHSREFLVFVRVFEQLVSKYVPNVAKHIAKLEKLDEMNDSGPDWEKLLSNFFIDIFPLPVVFKIMDAYIVEKYKIIYRFAMAHIITLESKLLEAKSITDIDKILFTFVPEVNEESLFKTAFSLTISRKKIWNSRRRQRKLSIGDFDKQDRIRIFHKPLPHLTQPSQFLRDDDLMTIWSWVPCRYKLLNLKLLYSHVDGYHLINMYRKCQGYEPLLLVMKCTNDTVFGAYLSRALVSSEDQGFYGTGETFLFSLKPTAEKFSWECGNQDQSFILSSDKYIAIGAGRNGNGIWINQNLDKASSDESDTFRNKPLCGEGKKTFGIVYFELYGFY